MFRRNRVKLRGHAQPISGWLIEIEDWSPGNRQAGGKAVVQKGRPRWASIRDGDENARRRIHRRVDPIRMTDQLRSFDALYRPPHDCR